MANQILNLLFVFLYLTVKNGSYIAEITLEIENVVMRQFFECAKNNDKLYNDIRKG
mgnify:CR=1 FL=1